MFRKAAILFIRGYRAVLSPFMGNQCRYTPTCSCYTEEAIETHGLIKGLWLGIFRICSCHPFASRPWDDPVPKRFEWAAPFRYKKSSLKSKNQNH